MTGIHSCATVLTRMSRWPRPFIAVRMAAIALDPAPLRASREESLRRRQRCLLAARFGRPVITRCIGDNDRREHPVVELALIGEGAGRIESRLGGLPCASMPVSKMPGVSLDAVCASLSLFVQTTVVPTGTVIVAGENAKSWITT